MVASSSRRPQTLQRNRSAGPVPYSYADQPLNSSFFRRIKTYPMLEADEELDLIERWQTKGDSKAFERLVTSHLRLIVKVATQFRRYGLPIEDLISEGSIGLLQAINRFDPERGSRLATYAKWWIRAAMQEHIMRSWSLVRIGTTVGQKKLFFNLRKLKVELCGNYDSPLTANHVDTIVDRLEVSPEDVESMDVRMTQPDFSLNELVVSDETTEWQEWLTDDTDNQETQLAHREEIALQRLLLSRVLDELPERDRRIFVMRRIEEDRPTLNEISEIFEISPERVRQIEHEVYNRICSVLNESSMSAPLAEPLSV